MKYKMRIDVRISDEVAGYPGFQLTHEQLIELKSIGDAGELLLRIHQLIRTAEEKQPR